MSKQSEKSGNNQVGTLAEVGWMTDFGSKKAALNLQLFEELRQKEVERLIALWKVGLENQYEELANTFKLRFQEDPTIFEGIDSSEVFTIFEQMSRHLLLFSPSKISADVTFDASVILQSHYSAFRVYWETFIPKEQDQPYHSTLNIYADQTLIFSGGGKAEEMIAEFVRIMPPLFEKMPHIQIG